MKQAFLQQLRIAFLFTLCVSAIALSAQQNSNERPEFPVFSLVEVQLEHKAELEDLLLLGFDVRFVSADNTLVTIVAMEHELDRLRDNGYYFQLVHEDLTSYQRARLTTPEKTSLQIGQGSLGGYFNYDEIIAFIDSLHAEYPSIMSEPVVIGQTYLERDIIAYKISSGANDGTNLPRSIITGMHHSNEPMSFIAPLYFTQWLLENYNDDLLATYMVDNREIWFVPVVNIDGYIFNETIAPNGGGLWRKNMRDNNENGDFEHFYDGVDLNRNYGYGWGFNNSGSNSHPGHPTYRGTDPFSESETQAIRDLCIDKNFSTALNFHSFSNLLVHPTEPNGDLFPDMDLFLEYLHDMTKDNGYIYGNTLQTVNYTANGDHDSWMYGEQEAKDKIIAFTPEIGNVFDLFWPPSNRIIPLAEDNLYMQQYMVMAAGAYLKPVGHRFDDTAGGNGNMEAEAGETVELIFSLRNKGYLVDAESVSVTLSCSDDYVSVDTNTVVTDIAALTTEEISFSISLSEDMPSGHTVTMTMQFAFQEGSIISESYKVTFGMPLLLFFDNATDGMKKWEVDGSWNVTDERAPDGQLVFNDSPYGYYQPNMESSMTLSETVDLTTMNNAFLTFKTRYHLEKDFDLAQLQISTDHGQSWEPLPGNYSTTGAGGSGLQPAGDPVYNGFRDIMWVEEWASLKPYMGEEILIRFYMASNHQNQAEGWFIDDIRIIGYSDEPTTPDILYLTKLPNTEMTGPYPVEARVSVMQGNPDVSLFYSNNNTDFLALEMQFSGPFLYQAAIPEMVLGDTVYYYVEVIDDMDNSSFSELMSFIITDEPAVLVVCTDEILATLPLGATEEHIISISNDGLLPLDWMLELEPILSISDPEGDQTGDSPDIITVYADITNNNEFFFKIEFADDIDSDCFVAYVLIDSDQNPETGWTGEELFDYSGWGIGVDYLIVLDYGNLLGQGSRAYLINPISNTPYAFRNFETEGNSISVKIPLLFINDNDVIHIAAYVESESGFDAAPDEGYGVITQPGIVQWLNHDLRGGRIHAGESIDVRIEMNSNNVNPNSYEAQLFIKSNDPLSPVHSIAATLNVLSDQAGIISFVFDEQVGESVIDHQTNAIDVIVESGADLNNLVAQFSLTEGATAFVNDVIQVSGTTANDFTEPLVYNIIAEDGISQNDWTVTVSHDLYVPETHESMYSIYPNPTDGLFTLELLGDHASEKQYLEIYNVFGDVVLQKDLPSGSLHLLDLTGRPDGIYFIRVVAGSSSQMMRVIKQ